MDKTCFLRQYATVFVTFLVIDAVWLGLIAPRFYRAQIGFLLREQPNWWAAAGFYFLYIAGMTVFVVSPGVREGSPARAAALGALFGLVAYATYDLTNLATIKGWPLTVTLVDLVWGTVLTATTGAASTFVLLKWFARAS